MDRPPPELPSEILVRRAQERDPAAVAELYARYRERVRSALRRLLGPMYRATLDSEDALHDAIVAALAKLEGFRYRGEGSFLAWLLRVARNEALMRMRAQRAGKRDRGREVPLSEAPEPPALEATPSAVAQGRETEDLVREALDRLDANEREVIVMRRYLDLDASQIAEAMELPSPGAARALLSRAQAHLAVLLDREPPS